MLHQFMFKSLYYIYYFLVFYPLAIITFIVKNKHIFNLHTYFDVENKQIVLKEFNLNNKILKKIPYILNALNGELSFVGSPLMKTKNKRSIQSNIKPGLISLYYIRELTVWQDNTIESSIKDQLKDRSLKSKIKLVLKFIFVYLFFGNQIGQKTDFDLFDIPIRNLNLADLKKEIMINKNHLFFVNADNMNKVYKNKKLREILKKNKLNVIDGSGVNMAAKILGHQVKENLNGTDLFPVLLNMFSKDNKKVYFIGSSQESLEGTINYVKTNYPNLIMVGKRNGYFTKEQKDSIFQDIAISQADYIFVAMGTPIQEVFIQELSQKYDVGTCIGVGGLFDFYSGNKARAPRFLRELGMEWLYRLYLEPRRLWKRYIIGNPLFILRVYTERFKRRQLSHLESVSK